MAFHEPYPSLHFPQKSTHTQSIHCGLHCSFIFLSLSGKGSRDRKREMQRHRDGDRKSHRLAA